jgi:hypothetical protein
MCHTFSTLLSVTNCMLSMCGHLMSCIMGYVAGFLGCSEGYRWKINMLEMS